MSCTHHCHLFFQHSFATSKESFKKIYGVLHREMNMMNAIHCRHLFFHVNYYLHQGDNDKECMFIVVIFF
jgi:hypothetical protein